MTEVILHTKLYIPDLRKGYVSRSRLTNRLTQADQHKLVLITAPAGFGKTTLLAEWVATLPQRPVWLSLDDEDNTLPRFLRYLVSAIGTVVSDFGAEILELLDSMHTVQSDLLVTSLVNELLTLDNAIRIILDDYYVITNPLINDLLSFLLMHMPPHVQFVIASREQTPLKNLSLMRGRGQVLEIDTGHLRFTAKEVEQFLQDVMQLELSHADRIKLEMRTEGWITGLQWQRIVWTKPRSVQMVNNPAMPAVS